MTPKWLMRSGLLLVPAVLAGMSTCLVVGHRERVERERAATERRERAFQAEVERTEKLFTLIDVPSSTSWCQKLMGRDPELLVDEPGWPKRLGDIEGLEQGCDAHELWIEKKLRPLDGEYGSYRPDTPVYWLRWRYPTLDRWIAVAVPGGDTRVCCKSFPVVAKRKNF